MTESEGESGNESEWVGGCTESTKDCDSFPSSPTNQSVPRDVNHCECDTHAHDALTSHTQLKVSPRSLTHPQSVRDTLKQQLYSTQNYYLREMKCTVMYLGNRPLSHLISL